MTVKAFKLWSKPQLGWLHLSLPSLTEVKEIEAGRFPALEQEGPRQRRGRKCFSEDAMDPTEKAPEPEATRALASIMTDPFSQDYKIKLTENLSTSQQALSAWKIF